MFPRQIWHNQRKAEYREDTASRSFLSMIYYEVYLKLIVWRQLSYIDLRFHGCEYFMKQNLCYINYMRPSDAIWMKIDEQWVR